MLFQVLYAAMALLVSVAVMLFAVTMNPRRFGVVLTVVALSLAYAAVWLASDTELVWPITIFAILVMFVETVVSIIANDLFCQRDHSENDWS